MKKTSILKNKDFIEKVNVFIDEFKKDNSVAFVYVFDDCYVVVDKFVKDYTPDESNYPKLSHAEQLVKKIEHGCDYILSSTSKTDIFQSSLSILDGKGYYEKKYNFSIIVRKYKELKCKQALIRKFNVSLEQAKNDKLDSFSDKYKDEEIEFSSSIKCFPSEEEIETISEENASVFIEKLKQNIEDNKYYNNSNCLFRKSFCSYFDEDKNTRCRIIEGTIYKIRTKADKILKNYSVDSEKNDKKYTFTLIYEIKDVLK